MMMQMSTSYGEYASTDCINTTLPLPTLPQVTKVRRLNTNRDDHSRVSDD